MQGVQKSIRTLVESELSLSQANTTRLYCQGIRSKSKSWLSTTSRVFQTPLVRLVPTLAIATPTPAGGGGAPPPPAGVGVAMARVGTRRTRGVWKTREVVDNQLLLLLRIPWQYSLVVFACERLSSDSTRVLILFWTPCILSVFSV